MNVGAHILCRKIDGGPAAHQFVALVPESPTALAGFAKDVAGVRCVILGAYAVQSFLRAAAFAASDTGHFAKLVKGSEMVESSKVEPQMCLLTLNDDPLLEAIYRAFVRYRSYEGTGQELRYPLDPTSTLKTISMQLDSRTFNSNSWAQSLVFWSSLAYNGHKAQRDFGGLDVGNDRQIPEQYFRHMGSPRGRK